MLKAPTRASQYKMVLLGILCIFMYIDVKVEALCAGYKMQELLVTPGSKHQAAPHDCFSKSELLAPTAEVTTDH